MMREKRESEGDGISMFAQMDKALLVQEAKVFNETPLRIEKCTLVLTKVLFLLYQGETFNSKDATSLFFSITKSFQSKDTNIRPLLYLAIKELSRSANDIIMVISSLIQDINTVTLFRAEALRCLGTVIDPSMVSGIERLFKQAMMADKNPNEISSSFCTSIHLFKQNEELLRRWSPDISAICQSIPSRSISYFHVLGLLYLIKQDDHVALHKLVQTFQGGSGHVLAVLLVLRVYSVLLAQGSSMIIDLKPFLRLRGKSEIISLEAAKIICLNPSKYASDIVFAINTLQLFLSSKNSIQKFAALRTLNAFLVAYPNFSDLVGTCNSEIEALISDSNRNIAALAVTTLLKTGKETSVDALFSQISGHFNEIGDEFKTSIVHAVHSLGVKFPSKVGVLLSFLGASLKEEGDFSYKSAVVFAVSDITTRFPQMAYSALAQLCEFIEDSEYPQLTSKVLHLLGKESDKVPNPARLIRFIYNRIILETPVVREAAVGSLINIALNCPHLRASILSIMKNELSDSDDRVRDRVVAGVSAIQAGNATSQFLFDSEACFSLDSLDDYLEGTLASKDGHQQKMVEFDPSMIERVATDNLLDVVPSLSSSAVGPHQDGFYTPLDIQTKLATPQMQAYASTLGDYVFTSTDSSELTDKDCEYFISCKKHFYQEGILLEFKCRNTVRELELCNISMAVAMLLSDTQKEVRSKPIDVLPFNEEKSLYVPFALDWSNYPDATFSCIFLFVSMEAHSGQVIDERAQLEKYKVRDVNIAISDYLLTRAVVDFDADWASMSAEDKITLELASASTMREARSAIVGLLGMETCVNLERADAAKAVVSLFFAGEMITISGNRHENFSIRARLAQIDGKIACEIAARSHSRTITHRILETFC